MAPAESGPSCQAISAGFPWGPFSLSPVFSASAHWDREAKQSQNQGKLPSADATNLMSSFSAAGFTILISTLSLNTVQAD